MQPPCQVLVVNPMKKYPAYYHTVVEEILHQLFIHVYPCLSPYNPMIYSVSELPSAVHLREEASDGEDAKNRIMKWPWLGNPTKKNGGFNGKNYQ